MSDPEQQARDEAALRFREVTAEFRAIIAEWEREFKGEKA